MECSRATGHLPQGKGQSVEWGEMRWEGQDSPGTLEAGHEGHFEGILAREQQDQICILERSLGLQRG